MREIKEWVEEINSKEFQYRLDKKYILTYCPKKKFFFWGIFKRLETIQLTLGFTPKRFFTFKLGERRGVIADFSNLSDREFMILLGRLALVEIRHYTLGTTYSEKEGRLFLYIPIGSNPYSDYAKLIGEN